MDPIYKYSVFRLKRNTEGDIILKEKAMVVTKKEGLEYIKGEKERNPGGRFAILRIY